MSARKAKEPEVYEYHWIGDYAAVIDGYSTPEGSGVLAKPFEHFKTTAPLDHPLARPVQDEGEQPQEDGPEATSEEAAL